MIIILLYVFKILDFFYFLGNNEKLIIAWKKKKKTCTIIKNDYNQTCHDSIGWNKFVTNLKSKLTAILHNKI